MTVEPADILAYIKVRGIKEHDAMMYLRDLNCISDNCIGIRDIAHADCAAAMQWIKWMTWRKLDRK
ncbi:MAG: hypothetical protein RL595_1161 [Planctomycetota bacterium]|jgi:hypothetical protein